MYMCCYVFSRSGAAAPVASRPVGVSLTGSGTNSNTTTSVSNSNTTSAGTYNIPRVRSTPPDSNAEHADAARPGLYMPAKSGGIAPPGPPAASLLGSTGGVNTVNANASPAKPNATTGPSAFKPMPLSPANNAQGGQRGPMQQIQPSQLPTGQNTPQRSGSGGPPQFPSHGFSPQPSPSNQQQPGGGQQQPQRGPMPAGGNRSDQQFPRNTNNQQQQQPQQQGIGNQQRAGAPPSILGNNPQQPQQPQGVPRGPQTALTPQQLAQQFQPGQVGPARSSPFLGAGQPAGAQGNPSNLSLAAVLGGAAAAGAPAGSLNNNIYGMQQLLAQHQQQQQASQQAVPNAAALMFMQQYGAAAAAAQQAQQQQGQGGGAGGANSNLPIHLQQQLLQMQQQALMAGGAGGQANNPQTQLQQQMLLQGFNMHAQAFLQQQRAQQFNAAAAAQAQQQFAGMQRAGGPAPPGQQQPGGPLNPQQLLQQQQHQFLLQQAQQRMAAAGGPAAAGLGVAPLQSGGLGALGGGLGGPAQSGPPRGFPPAGMPPGVGVGVGQTFPPYTGTTGAAVPQQRNAVQMGGTPNVNAPTFNPGAVNVHGATTGVGGASVGGAPKPYTPLPNYTGPPGAQSGSGGLSAGPGASGSTLRRDAPPYERKPLDILDEVTGKPVDLSDLKKPEPRPSPAVSSASPAAVPITQPLTNPSTSPTSSPIIPAVVGSATPSALDLSDTDLSTAPLARKPLAIISPSKYVAGHGIFQDEVQQDNAATSSATSTTSNIAAQSSSISSPPAVTSSTPSNTGAAVSSASSSAVGSSSAAAASPASSASTTSSVSTLPAPTPYIMPKRAVMSLSPQPGAGSGLAPSVSSESLSTLRAGNGSPALNKDDKEKEKEKDKSEGADSKESKTRGPILPLSGAQQKLTYAPRTTTTTRPVRSLKSDSTDSSASSDRNDQNRSSPTAVTSVSTSSTEVSKGNNVDGIRVVNGRTIYDMDFLLSFKDLLAKPHNFPAVIQPEIEVQRDNAGTPSARTVGAGAVGGAGGRRSPTTTGGGSAKKEGPGDGQWTRGQTLAPQAGARGAGGMAPQGGRGLFAQAGARAVMADQQRSRDTGPAKSIDRRDTGRDDRGRDQRDSRSGPRGGGGGRDGGRDTRTTGGDRRGGQTGQQPYLEGPVAPLTKSGNRWQVGAGVSGEMDRIKKRVQGLLNKLALDKFDTLTHQLTDLIVENRSEGIPLLSEVVGIIFDKALSEQFFSSMYADLCVEVSKAVSTVVEFEPELAASNQAAADAKKSAASDTPVSAEEEEKREREAKKQAKNSPFRIMLLSKCQLEFEAGLKPVDKEGKTLEDIHEEEHAQKRRFLGNIKFIGELYKKGMLLERIMHTCVAHLIGDIQNPVEEDLEAVCNLLSTIGKSLDHEKARAHVNSYFDRFEAFSKNMQLSSRIRFMCLDLIDLRRSGWNSKRRPAEVKTLEQVRREAAQEAKAAAANNQRPGQRGIPVPASGFRPMGGLTARGPPGSQDVRGGVAKRDRYAVAKAPVTPVSTAQTPNFPATPAAAGKAGAATPASGGAYQPRKGSAGSASASSADIPSASPVDADRAASMIRTLIQEYILAGDVRESRAALEELHAPDLHFLVVSQSITKALSENKHRVKIAELCSALYADRLLTRSDFERGLTESLQTVDADFISDECPKAAEFLGDMLGRWVEQRCLDLPVLASAATHLLESGETANIFIHTCRTVTELYRDDAHTARTLVESGGVNVLTLMGQEDMTANIKECARLFERKPFMLQLYPTMPYELELRQALQLAVSGSTAQLSSVLLAHSSDHANHLFLRCVVESVLTIAGSDSAAITLVFGAVQTAAPTASNSMVAQLGAMQTASAFLTSNPTPGLLRSVFESARQSKLVSDQTVWTQLEDDAQQLELVVPPDFAEAIKAVSA
jgi:translation initiation factor 4G